MHFVLTMSSNSSSKSSSRSVAKILAARDSGLQPLLERAQILQSLTRVLREALDPVIADHISLVNLDNDTAIVAADTPAWLTKVRYLAPILLQQLQQQRGLHGLRKVQFKVQPVMETPPAPPARRAVLSTNSAQLLDSAASGIHDPALAAALRRLSKHSRQGD
jgi:hypothetical protein